MVDPNMTLPQLLASLRRHFDRIEAALPPSDRAVWRRIAAHADSGLGRKQQDSRDLLLQIAELDLDSAAGAKPMRALAAEVVGRYPVEGGAGLDDRQHVVLPDGSRPGRKDLITRLAKRYQAERAAYRQEVALARQTADRVARSALEAKASPAGVRWLERHKAALNDPAYRERLRRAAQAPAAPTTAYGTDLIQRTVRSRLRKP